MQVHAQWTQSAKMAHDTDGKNDDEIKEWNDSPYVWMWYSQLSSLG